MRSRKESEVIHLCHCASEQDFSEDIVFLWARDGLPITTSEALLSIHHCFRNRDPDVFGADCPLSGIQCCAYCVQAKQVSVVWKAVGEVRDRLPSLSLYPHS